jgi:hypothetical protein
MILKLLLSVLFFIILPIFKLSSLKFRSKIIFAALFIGFSFTNVNAQCNPGATAGVVSSNHDKICVGSTEDFWSAGGWGGGTWSSSNSSIVQITTSGSGGNPRVKGLATGTVDIIYTLTQSGCSEVKTSKKTITVYGALGATGNISGASVQCNGNTSQVYSVPPVANAETYTWTVPSGWTIVSGQNTNSITTTIGSGSDNITLAVANGCKTNNLEYYYVGINSNKTAKPTVTTSGSTTLCAGSSVTLTSSIQNSYLWSTGETTRSITVSAAGTYTVKTTQSGYCPSDPSNPVNVTVITAPTFTVSPSSSVCANTDVTYTTQSGKTNYTWSVPGTAGTDYVISSGGIGTGSNTVTLQWKTGGSKTVTANYNTGCTGLAQASNTTTVTRVAAGTASSSPQVCINTAITPITHTLSGVTGLGTASSLPAGVSAALSVDKSTLTISGTPSQSGTFDYSITLSTSCGNVTATGRITVNPASVGGTVSSQSICVGTQPAPISLTGSTGAIQWQVSTDNNTFNNITGATANPLTSNQMGTLSSTRYYRAVVTNGSCAPAISTVATITMITTDRGVTRGGKHICLGSATPTLTLYSYDLNNTVYPDASKVVKWQYSDDAGNTTWNDIPGTANAITYTPSGTLSAFRTYRAVVKNGSCNQQNAIETRVDVDPLPTPTFTASAGAISCIGTNVTYTTEASQNNYLWSVSGTLNTDYSITAGGLGANSSTVTLKWLTEGNKTVTINYKNSNGCTATVATSSTTDVKATPAAPIAGTINPATCTISGSVNLTGLPTGTWTLTQTGTVSNSITNTGSSYTVSNLAAGTYAFTVSNGSCTSMPLSNIQIADQSTATWDGTSWVDGITPNISKSIVFAGPYTVKSDLEACSCTINSGVSVSVASKVTLKITNAVNVTSGGSLTFEDSASLLQVNDAAVNTGNITYKRISRKIRLADFVYWSTPVSPFKLIDVSPGTQYNMYMGFTGTNWLVTDRNTNMMVGKGYIIRGPQNYSNTAKADYQASFTGVPNNGVLSGETLQAGKFYLIGNPYPSALKASAFLAGNTFMNGTLYFWTHNTPVVLGGAYQYTTSDYAAYNLTGGTGTAPSANPGNNQSIPSGYIAAGQSFFASAATDGTVQFNNSMRRGSENDQFFKPAKTAKETTTEDHHIWLNLTNDGGAFKQMLVGYIDGATNGVDVNYDGQTFDGNIFVDFYSVNNQNKFTIQGRSLPFAETDVVPLGYRSTIAGDFTISIDQVDGDLTNHAVYIEDKKTGLMHDLKAGKFTFTTTAGTYNDRLVLRYTNKTLGTGDFENTESDLIISVKDKVIKVNSAIENIRQINIFDVTGKNLYAKNKIEATDFQISNLQSGNQVLFIKVTLENGFIVSKKIIFN